MTGVGQDDQPGNGDYTICIKCAKPCVFDSKSPGGLRKPNDDEARDMSNNTLLNTALDLLRRQRQ